MFRLVIATLLLVAGTCCIAQGTWDIRERTPVLASACTDCLDALKAKPKEVQMGLHTDENKDVWFVITDAAWIGKLFSRSGDGLAVDVVPRSYYDCGKPHPVQTDFHKGTLLKPIYLTEITQNTRVAETGAAAVKVGRLPTHLTKEPVELALILLKDRNVCHTTSFYDLASYRWDLLNMGLYMDTLTYAEPGVSEQRSASVGILKRKALHFTIPFERNKSTYSAEDLRPLRDSLRLTDFTITRIAIEAYSSVEGPEDRNLRLQAERAQSIVDALQSFQSPSIERDVRATENWAEFLRDVRLTSHADLAEMSKTAIKERMRDKRVLDHLEPILKAHRKAVITVDLVRKDGDAGLSPERVVRDFEKAIADKNIARARQLQNSVFDRIMDEDLPSAFLDRLDIPVQREFSALLNSRAAFHYFRDPRDAMDAYTSLIELKRLLPEDAHINYNLCAITFRVWLQGGAITVDPLAFKRDIETLRTKGIAEPLVLRMLVNHAIIMAEFHMRKGEYGKKDERMDFIFRNYAKLPMGERDHLSLAQYFASFANYDKSLSVIEPRITGVDADEDLIFYHLNLTIFDQERTKRPATRQVIQYAITKNKARFCHLFDPFGSGGITFQLLDDPYLFETYCATCQ